MKRREQPSQPSTQSPAFLWLSMPSQEKRDWIVDGLSELWNEFVLLILILGGLRAAAAALLRTKEKAIKQNKRNEQWMKINGNGVKGRQLFVFSWSGMSFGPLQVKSINSIHSIPLLFFVFMEWEWNESQEKNENWWNWAAGRGIVFSFLYYLWIMGWRPAPQRENQRFSWLGVACAHTLSNQPSNAWAQPNAFDWFVAKLRIFKQYENWWNDCWIV